MLRFIRNLFVLLAVIIGLVFGYFNFEAVSVDLLWTQIKAPLIVMLALAFLLGLVLAFLVLGISVAKYRHRYRKTHKQLQQTEEEADKLRGRPAFTAPES